MEDAGQELKALLQLQLASDSSSVVHLPYILQTLTVNALKPSSHLAKWTTRIQSLLHSKDPGARWAGLSLAHKSSLLSRTIMMESAQSWLQTVLPMLSRNEPVPNLKAGLRLLATIFTNAVDMPEFQRQVSTPNIQKFTTGLVDLLGRHQDVGLEVLSLNTLAQIIPFYPNAHRSFYSALATLSLRFLNGSAPNPTNGELMEAAARLYTVLHLTGGKVGAANLWRKCIDETMACGWNAFFALRTTFPSEYRIPTHVESRDDPLTTVPLNLDRLRCCSVVLRNLLSTVTYRPVQVPCGQMVKHALELLGSTRDGKVSGFVDPGIHAIEISIVPMLWRYGCDLLTCLVQSLPVHLTPYLTRIITTLTYHLEHFHNSLHHAFILESLETVLFHCHSVDSSALITRLMKTVLPSLTLLLTSTSKNSTHSENDRKGKKAKKRAKNYDGDEVFKVTRDVICPTSADGRVVLAALEVTRHCQHNQNMTPSLYSLSSRFILSILITLPGISPASLSPDMALFDRVYGKVQSISVEFGSGTTSSMSKSIPLVIETVLRVGNRDTQETMDLLLHPRVPPLLRSNPPIESLALFRVEESQEEDEFRKAINVDTTEISIRDVVMKDDYVKQPLSTSSKLITTSTPPIEPTLITTKTTPTRKPIPKLLGPLSRETKDDVQPHTKIGQPPQQSSSALPSGTAERQSQLFIMQPLITENEDDEDMPVIDMGSDSEEDD